MLLFESFGIDHGLMFDDDNSKKHHDVINKYILSKKNLFTLSDPVCFSGCLEKHFELDLYKRGDQKPLEIIRALEERMISPEQLDQLKELFCKALGI